MPATLLGRRLMGVSPGRIESQFLPRLFKYDLMRNLSDLPSATDECESCANLIGNLNDSRSATKEGFHYFPPIITSFVRCPRTCRHLMRLIISDPAPPHPVQFNSLLEGMLGPGFDQIRTPMPLLALMIAYGAIPDLSTFKLIIQFYLKHLAYQPVLDVVFTQMKALGVEADDIFYETLMDGVCASFGPVVGFKLLKRLRSRNRIRNPLSCYNAIVGQFGKREMIDNLPMVLVLIDVLQHMKRQRVFPEEEIYNCLVEARKQARKVFPIGYLIQAIDIGRLIYAEGIKVGTVFPTIKPYTRLGCSRISYDKVVCKTSLKVLLNKWRKLVTKK